MKQNIVYPKSLGLTEANNDDSFSFVFQETKYSVSFPTPQNLGKSFSTPRILCNSTPRNLDNSFPMPRNWGRFEQETKSIN
jgi:hypothetical protein